MALKDLQGFDLGLGNMIWFPVSCKFCKMFEEHRSHYDTCKPQSLVGVLVLS